MKKCLSNRYVIIFIGFLLTIPPLAYGQSDLIEIRTPNAMIIFDSSSSMNQDENGNTVNSGNAAGEDGKVKDYEGGGNHPNSKLFKAKKQLKDVIKDIEDINLGFSTYGQAKTDLRRGYYVRGRQNYTPIPTDYDQWKWTKKYWRFNNYAHSFQTKTDYGDTYTEKNHWFDDSPANNGQPVSHTGQGYKADLIYKKCDLNAELNLYTYCSDKHDHYEEYNPPEGRVLYFSDNNPIVCDAQFTKPWGSWKTYDEASTPFPSWKCKGPTKVTTQGAPYTPKWGSKWDEFGWLQFDGLTYPVCPDTWGSDYNWNSTGDPPGNDNAWTKWTKVDPADPRLSGTHPVKVTGLNCYDASTYSYPADGSANKPHTWSYYRDLSGNWSTKPNPYYPSRDGGGTINNSPGTFDNHYLFINIPQVDDSITGYVNRNAIVDILDLNPIQSPETGKFHTKLPVKALDPDPKKRNSVTSSADTPVKQTPLYAALKDVKDYFQSYYNDQDALSKAGCRGNAVVLITDGLESCEYSDALHPNFGAAAGVAEDLKKAPLGVKTFVIGFGTAAGTNKSSLDDIARKGGTCKSEPDCAWFAATSQELQTALQAIFAIIKGDAFGRSSPVVSRSRDRLYRGYFNYNGWKGHLMAYDLNTDGTIKGEAQWDDGAALGKGGDAGWVMKAKKRGKAYTWIEAKFQPNREDFDDKNVNNLDSFVNPSLEDINGDGKVDKKDAKTIINFILDANYDDSTDGGAHGPGYHKGKRAADWLLGDIYHSTALVVGAPPLNLPDAPFSKKYSDFKTTWKNRETVIYVGANDGMLHAINDNDGTEKFSIIPKNLLGKLKDIRNAHQFYVDSSPRAYDVFFGADWHTVVVSGERGGGNYYFAVDVTDPSDPNYPKVLWEWTDSAGRLGFTWSRPEIGWVRLGGQEKFVAFVGGGYSSTDNVGNTFYVIDIGTGAMLRSFDIGGTTNKVPAGATAFDSDLDGRVNGVYFTDINGVLWKIKIDGEEDVSKWQLIPLFDDGRKQAAFYPPAVTKNNQGKILVYYGQGDELNLFEKDKSNSFFEVWDKGDSGQLLWEEKLEKGEKVLASPAVANNVVYFTSWTYTGVSDDCGAGKGRLFGLTITSAAGPGDLGALVLDPLTGAQLGSSKKYLEFTDYFPESKGIPSGPIVTNGMIYISTSLNGDRSPSSWRIPSWGGGMRLKSWREVF